MTARLWRSSAGAILIAMVVPSTPRPAVPAAPSRNGEGRIFEEIQRLEYRFSSAGDGRWSAPNRAQNLRSRLGDDGLELTRRMSGGLTEDWRFAMHLSGFGREGSVAPVPPAVPQVSDNRVGIERPTLGLTEWYINDARGIEQGFTIARRPAGEGPHRPLVIEMAIRSDLSAELADDGQSLVFTTATGAAALRYAGLVAWDFLGRRLPARLVLSKSFARILVDDMAAVYPIIVDPLLTTPDWTGESNAPTALFGFSVASAGRLNNDEFDDIIVGAPEFDNGPSMNIGKVFVYYGTATGPGAMPGWTAEGTQPNARFGHAVGSGDVNGDLFTDIIVGSPLYNNAFGVGAGRSFVYLGSAGGLAVPPTPVWIGEGDQPGANFGWSVAAAGDLDDNGTQEVLVGAPLWESIGAEDREGRVSVYRWSAPSLIPMGAPIQGNQNGAQLGFSVASAGKVNFDPFDDIVLGAPFYDTFAGADAGRAFVYTGPGLVPLGVLNGTQGLAHLGHAVASGDVNNDGRSDVIVGAPHFDTAFGADAGQAYVYAGPGLVLIWSGESQQGGAQLGASVAFAGDVDGDDYGDIVVGAPFQDGRGRAFLWRGSIGGPPAPGHPGNAAWTAQGDLPGDRFGVAVASAGRVNEDLLSDVIIGASHYDNPSPEEGRASVYLGFVPPVYLEFGPKGSPRRVEAVAAAYTAVMGLVDGQYSLSGSANVAMGPASRPFLFTDLTAVKDPNDTAGNGQPAFRVTGGSATVNASALPIDYADPNDMDLTLYSFTLDASGAASETPSDAVGNRKGLQLDLGGDLTHQNRDVLLFPAGVAIRQSLDFEATLVPDAGGMIFKDFPLAIEPQAGTSYMATRTRLDLGLSDLVHMEKERGSDGIMMTRCDRLLGDPPRFPCLDEANDGLFSLGNTTSSNWDLNQYAALTPPAGSVGTPFIDRDGLRATLHLDTDGTWQPLFPAGFQISLESGSRMEIVAAVPQGDSLEGSLGLEHLTGASDASADCRGERFLSASFNDGVVGADGRLQVAGVTPLIGGSELSWGGDGEDPADPEPFRGFYVGGLDPNTLSMYVPGTLATVDAGFPDESVQRHLLRRVPPGGLTGRGTYAGLNIAKVPGLAMTTGVDVSCPCPDPNTGHSLSVTATDVGLYVRRGGVNGIADGGALGSRPFPYMGYNLTLDRFGATFLDNIWRESGVSASQLVVPHPSDIGFTFGSDSIVTLTACGEPGSLGDLAQPVSEQTLAYWDADFTPRAVVFDEVDAGRCDLDLPPSCPPETCDVTSDDVRYLYVQSVAPLELDPNDPPRDRFEDEVAFELTPKPTGQLACSQLLPGSETGTVRSEFEPGRGFDADLMTAELLPRDPNGADPPDPEPDAPRYQVDSEFHLPFYMATRARTRVERGRAAVLGEFADLESKLDVSMSVLGGLFDIDFPLKYMPPDPNDLDIPARFVGGDDLLDLGFMELTTFMKVLGKDPLGIGDLQNKEHPEMYLGFLSDLAAYAEAKVPDVDCGAACASLLEEFGSFSAADPQGEIEQMLPSLDAGLDRLKQQGITKLKSLVSTAMQDTIGSSLPADIARAAGVLKKTIDNVREGVDVFKTANLTGPGAFGKIDDPALPGLDDAADWVLDNIDLKADVDIVDFINFKGALEFNRHNAEGHSDVTASASDVPIGWVIDNARARRIFGTFTYAVSGDELTVEGFDGGVELADIEFGEVAMDTMSLLVGMGNPPGDGNDSFYLAGNASGHYKSVTGDAAFFIGKSRSIDPIVAIDPDVGEFLEGRTELFGVYARFGGSFPLFGGPDCAPFRLNVGGESAFWLFLDVPAFGTKMRAYAHGSLACVVSARADVTMLGGKTGDVWQLAGHGFVAGGVGWCEPEDWSSRRAVLRDDWCLACVMDGEFHADSRSGGFHGDLHGPDCN
ncbi:MAG: hypothetical protein ACREAA_19105 [Candidatus Polarisedimenticolia bacterium]